MFSVKLLSPNLILPKRVNPYAAGLDIFAQYKTIIPPHDRQLISTGLALELQQGTYGRLASTSGNSLKLGMEVGAGVIDSDYRGEIKVLLYNHSNQQIKIEPGMKLCQLIVSPIISTYEILTHESLTKTERGSKGFGELI